MMTTLPAHITGPARFPLAEMAVLTLQRLSIHRLPLHRLPFPYIPQFYRFNPLVRTVSGLAQLARPETVRTYRP